MTYGIMPSVPDGMLHHDLAVVSGPSEVRTKIHCDLRTVLI